MTTTVVVKVPTGANYRAELEFYDRASLAGNSDFMYANPGSELIVHVYGTRQVIVREVPLSDEKS